MNYSDNKKINDFMIDLQSLPSGKLELVDRVRKYFLVANRNLAEDIKYGGLVFSLSNSLVGGIFPYKEHISIEFSNGAESPDPSGILEGKGKKRRHIKIMEMQDIDAKNVSVFVEEAVKE